jgi:type III pantothenate kinase
MLLAIDIGNTNTVVGLYDANVLRNHFRVASSHNLTSDEAGLFVTGLLEHMNALPGQIDRIIIGSVVPPLTTVYDQMCVRFFRIDPILVSHEIPLPVRIEIEHPEQLGADRIANAAAAHALTDRDAIVVDLGTATNFDIVTKDGAYIGGVIAPGPETSMAALVEKAAKLFGVRFERPETFVGSTTGRALKAGLYFGTIGQIDFLLQGILKDTGFDNPAVIATGGLASAIQGDSKYITQVSPTLTLEGLRLIADHT